MKTISKIFLSMFLACVGTVAAHADSPLTSSDFAHCYNDIDMVAEAIANPGEVNPTVMNYLADKNVPVDERVAVVNAIGWNFNGLTTGDQFGTYLMKRYKAKNMKSLAKKLDAGTLVVCAYAKAMSNYFNVDEAVELAEMAVKKDQTNSFTIRYIAALIKAQKLMDSSWSDLYKVVENVYNDGSLKVDMRQCAIDAIWDYIKLYAEY
ncbi:MAG: hypothetical protein IJM84_00330 [Bacteroidaceae bacterium]|nr:hypothetical protein [Bacteroidaceae bacterium]MBQ7664297.1 hypothetical protein [Bacteroidaceae bacterium]